MDRRTFKKNRVVMDLPQELFDGASEVYDLLETAMLYQERLLPLLKFADDFKAGMKSKSTTLNLINKEVLFLEEVGQGIGCSPRETIVLMGWFMSKFVINAKDDNDYTLDPFSMEQVRLIDERLDFKIDEWVLQGRPNRYEFYYEVIEPLQNEIFSIIQLDRIERGFSFMFNDERLRDIWISAVKP